MKFPINMQIRSTSICFDSSAIIIIYIYFFLFLLQRAWRNPDKNAESEQRRQRCTFPPAQHNTDWSTGESLLVSIRFIGTVCVICAFSLENVLHSCVKYWRKNKSLCFIFYLFSFHEEVRHEKIIFKKLLIIKQRTHCFVIFIFIDLKAFYSPTQHVCSFYWGNVPIKLPTMRHLHMRLQY